MSVGRGITFSVCETVSYAAGTYISCVPVFETHSLTKFFSSPDHFVD
jgi:hypothetical protein